MARTGVSARYLYNNSPVVTELPVTLACWFNAPNTTANLALMTLGGRTKNERVGIQASGNVAGDPIRAQSSDSANSVLRSITSTGFSANTWHHAAGVFASSTSRTSYLDGGGSGTNTGSRVTTGLDVVDILLERANDAHQNLAVGLKIAECAIWNVALSAEEIAILGFGYSPLFVRPHALKNYYPLYGRRGEAQGEEDWAGNNDLLVSTSTIAVAENPRIIYPGRGQRVFAYPAAVAPSFRAAWVPRASQFIGGR